MFPRWPGSMPSKKFPIISIAVQSRSAISMASKPTSFRAIRRAAATAAIIGHQGASDSQSENVLHRIAPSGPASEKLRGLKRPARVGITAVALVYQLHCFANRAEDDLMLADVVASPHGVDADFVSQAHADHAFAAVTKLHLTLPVLENLRDMQCRASGRVVLD